MKTSTDTGVSTLVATPEGYLDLRPGVGCRLVPGDAVPGDRRRIVDDLPWSPMAVDPAGAADLCAAVLSGQVRVLEFGSGVSTVLLGLSVQINGGPGRVVAIEQDSEWVHTVRGLADGHGLDEVVEVRHSTLTTQQIDGPLPVSRWYRPNCLDGLTGPFDLILVDGPTAFRPSWQFDRWPAVLAAERLLGPAGTMVLDDTDRLGEAMVASTWQARLGPAWSVQRRGRATWFTKQPDGEQPRSVRRRSR